MAAAVVVTTLLCLPRPGAAAPGTPGTPGGTDSPVRLPGHVLPALADATPLALAARDTTATTAEPMTLTFVLTRHDQAGFARYLRALYDPRSPHHRQFVSAEELADRFGPSPRTYDRLLSYLRASGFELVERSRNRQTLTVRGAREVVERTFALRINDYRIAERTFYANDNDPALPAPLATHVAAISGLSSAAAPRHAGLVIPIALCTLALTGILLPLSLLTPLAAPVIAFLLCAGTGMFLFDAYGNGTFGGFGSQIGADLQVEARSTSRAVRRATGVGQTIGLMQFDTFRRSDVEDLLALVGAPTLIDNLSEVPVNGGLAGPGPGASEVLLDIATVMSIAPDAQIAVYSAPFDGRPTSYAQVFNAMIDDGVDVISNSWSSCEEQVSTAEAQAIDLVLQGAVGAGISVFNASGDTGSTCLTGSPDTIGVPADSPNATAVGGTTLIPGDGLTYGSETWWDGDGDTPPTGRGGFGVSRHFGRPAYQDGLTIATGRSIPDVVAYADPVWGRFICQASAGGCPNGLSYGGTSMAAPHWAAITATLNERLGTNLGFLNPLLYPLAGTDALHGPASMGSDFAHVGLGSPNVNALYLALAGEQAGMPDAATSRQRALAPFEVLTSSDQAVPADGATAGGVLVQLVDIDGNVVAGKSVTLAANSGNVEITPASAVTSVDNGSAVFRITSLVPETVTFTATDTTDGIELTETVDLTFGVPPAVSASIGAFPTTVTANGSDTTTITVALRDVLDRPASGKLIALSQGSGHSLIQGPSPPLTDANGEIEFIATNEVNETVTYTAVDVTDGELPIPGNAQVTFDNGAGTACGNEDPPTAEAGFLLTPFATGFSAGVLSFGGVNFGGCSGAGGPAFLDGSAYLTNFLNGDVFKLSEDGGTASTANRLATIGPTLGFPVVGKDGRIYAARVATTGNFTTGAIVELDPDTGAAVRTVAASLRCPLGVAVDPLSGDLFVGGGCSGAGSDEPAIHRVRDPADATPTVEVYATLPATPNGRLAFAPNGTLYVVTGYFGPMPPVMRVSGTDGPSTPTVEPIPDLFSVFWLNVAEADASGEATSLITLFDGALRLVDLTTDPPTETPLARDIGGGVIGPDGCLYSSTGTTVYKLSDATGACRFLSSTARPSLNLTPAAVSPDPPLGSTHTFTAAFHNVDTPEGTPVFFTILGANERIGMARTNTDGEATFSVTAVREGHDRITATASVGETTFTSNVARVTWVAGKHATFLTLNPSPTGGRPGQVIEVKAALTDVSASPPAAVPGATVDFTIGSRSCAAVTNANGIASCQITVGAPGDLELTATFAGTSQLAESTARVPFSVAGPPLLDHFVAYRTKLTRGSPRFRRFGGVTLSDDAFALTGDYVIRKQSELALPADKNNEGVGDPVTHLEAYVVKPVRRSPRFARRTDLEVTNQCGTATVTATRPVRLLVPTATDLSNPVDPPDESAHEVDHLLCYKVRVQRKRSDGLQVARLPKGVQVDATDQLQSRRYDLKKIEWLCNPVGKGGSPVVLSGPTKDAPFPITPATVRNPGSHLLCYRARVARKQIEQTGCGPAHPGDRGTTITPRQDRHLQQRGIFVANQFGTERLDTKREALVCVPSTVTQR